MDHILEGPDALVSLNRVIREVDVRLHADLVPEDEVIFVVDVEGLVLLAVRVDHRVLEVQREVELGLEVREELVDVGLRVARAARVGLVLAGRDSERIGRVRLRRELAEDFEVVADGRTKPVIDSELIELLHKSRVRSPVLLGAGLKSNEGLIAPGVVLHYLPSKRDIKISFLDLSYRPSRPRRRT